MEKAREKVCMGREKETWGTEGMEDKRSSGEMALIFALCFYVELPILLPRQAHWNKHRNTCSQRPRRELNLEPTGSSYLSASVS